MIPLYHSQTTVSSLLTPGDRPATLIASRLLVSSVSFSEKTTWPISFLCLFFFYVLVINSTRTHFEIQKGFSMLPGKSLITNFQNVLADANIPVITGTAPPTPPAAPKPCARSGARPSKII